MKTLYKIIIVFFIFTHAGFAQWSLNLSSNVELRTWKLTTKADKEETGLGGASIVLRKGSSIVSQSTSESNGDFSISIPANGEFILTVSYPGCNSKKFLINTQNVPEEVGRDNYKPTFAIGGFIMAKPFPGIDYSGLQNVLVKVEYKSKGKKFDHNEQITENGLSIVEKIADAENTLIEKFCSTNKAGNEALDIPDCPLAKSLYEKAISLIPGENYPVVQLEKVGLCLKDKEAAAKKAAEELAAKNAAKEEAAKKATNDALVKAAAEKAAAIKAAEELAAKNAAKEEAAKKAINDALAKAAAEKAAAIKAEETKLAKAAADKALKESQKKASPKTDEVVVNPKESTNNNTTTDKATKEKKEGIKVKQKSPQEIEAEAKLAKQREGMAKSKAEDESASKAESDKAKAKKEEKDKAAREKAAKQKEGLAKSKAEDEAAIKAEKEKALADREAKEKENKKLSYETKTNDGQGEMNKGNSNHSIPQVLGGADRYKERIKAADELFKMKRYDEAKTVYEEALGYKDKDPYALSKLTAIEKLTAPK